MNKKLRTFIFQLPVFFNHGTPIDRSTIKNIELDIIRLCGGLTETGTVSGHWESYNGEIISEAQHSYTVAVPEYKQTAFFDILERAKKETDQEALIVTEIGRTEFI